ncbi:MAG: YdcF family protein [bacterium]
MNTDRRSKSVFIRVHPWLKIVRVLIDVTGLASVILVVLCFTPCPWRVLTWLGQDPVPLEGEPDGIVLLSGGGIPSESGLMRCYEAAAAARRFSNAFVVVAMPEEADEQTSSAMRMFEEFEMRGVPRDRLKLEGRGRNTHEQAVNTFAMLGATTNQPVLLIVTSPDHMRRSLKTFRKAGFVRVHGAAAYDVAVNADLRYDVDTLGLQTAVGGNLVVRYQFWNNLMMEARIVREFFALGYYGLMGWL